jgi:hypothetical protein
MDWNLRGDPKTVHFESRRGKDMSNGNMFPFNGLCGMVRA